MDAMISRDAHRSHQFASVGPTGPRRDARASPSRVRFSLSPSLHPSVRFSPFHFTSSLSPPGPPSSTADFLVLHSAASLIVHVRLDARNGVACSAINGTLRFSRSGISPRTSLFVREFTIPPNRPIGFAGKSRDWFARTLYVCVWRPLRYRDEDLAEPRSSYRSTQSVAAEIITGVATLRLSDVWFYLWQADTFLVRTSVIFPLRYHIVVEKIAGLPRVKKQLFLIEMALRNCRYNRFTFQP